MFKPKIALTKDVFEKARIASRLLGCASVEEFVSTTLAAESDRVILERGGVEVGGEADVEEIAKKLKGLGYLE